MRVPGAGRGAAEAAGDEGELVVVLGLGNTLLSDDGAGIHALQRIERSEGLPHGVRMVDGGTAGPDLLPAVAGCDALLVLDAVDVAGEPGDVVRVEVGAGIGRAGPRTIHELGLETLLQDLALLGESPGRAVLFGIQPMSLEPGTRLSPPVAQGLERMVCAALDELRRWAHLPGGRAGTGSRRQRLTEDE